MKYKFNDYSGLMTEKFESFPGREHGINRDFKEVVEIIEEGLKIPHYLPGIEKVVFYLDTTVRVGGEIFYTCKSFLTKRGTRVDRGIKLSWEEWEGVIIQTDYYPSVFSILVTNDYLDSENQVWIGEGGS